MEFGRNLQILKRLPLLVALMGLVGTVACAGLPVQQQGPTKTPSFMLLPGPCTMPSPEDFLHKIQGADTAKRYPVELSDGTIFDLANTHGELYVSPELGHVVDVAMGLDPSKFTRMGGTVKDYNAGHQGLRNGSTVVITDEPSDLLKCAPPGAVALTVNAPDIAPDGSSSRDVPDVSEVSVSRVKKLLGKNQQGVIWATVTEICQQAQKLMFNVDAPESVCNGIGWTVSFLSAHAGDEIDSHDLYSQYVREMTPFFVETQRKTTVPYAIVNYEQFMQLHEVITGPLIKLK
jgi:hypothetical protein